MTEKMSSFTDLEINAFANYGCHGSTMVDALEALQPIVNEKFESRQVIMSEKKLVEGMIFSGFSEKKKEMMKKINNMPANINPEEKKILLQCKIKIHRQVIYLFKRLVEFCFGNEKTLAEMKEGYQI